MIYTHFLTGGKASDHVSVGLLVTVPCLKGQLEIIKGNGLCYKPEDVKELTIKINKICKMDLNRISKRSLEIAEKFYQKRIRKKFKNIYKRVFINPINNE